MDFPIPRRRRFALTEAMQCAISLANRFGIPRTFRNLYVIETAVECESAFRQISLAAAAANIREGALAEIARGGSLNYFFFEDARWRPQRNNYSQSDFEERDLRLMGQALRKLMHREPGHRSLLDSLSAEEADVFVAEFVGVSVQRIHELRRRMRIPA